MSYIDYRITFNSLSKSISQSVQNIISNRGLIIRYLTVRYYNKLKQINSILLRDWNNKIAHNYLIIVIECANILQAIRENADNKLIEHPNDGESNFVLQSTTTLVRSLDNLILSIAQLRKQLKGF